MDAFATIERKYFVRLGTELPLLTTRQDAPVEDWVVDGRTAGTWTTARNMTYVKILDASHMVRSYF